MHNQKLSTIRINYKDQPEKDTQVQLADTLYDLRPATNQSMRKYYTRQPSWVSDPLPTSTYSLQMQSQHRFEELEQTLSQTKLEFKQSRINYASKTMTQFDLSNRKPQFIIEISEEEIQRREQRKLNKKIEYQRSIKEAYSKELQRQKERIKILEEKELLAQKAQEERILFLKEKRIKELEKQKLEREQEDQEYIQKIRKSSQDSIKAQDRENPEVVQEVPEEVNIEQLPIEEQKVRLFNNVQIKEYVKQLEIPETLKELAQALKKGSKSSLEKIYRCFLFIHFHIDFNYKEQKSGKQVSDLTPQKILDSKQGTSLAQATLFQELLKLYKVSSKIIQGIGKATHNYTIGHKYKGNEIDHTWNIVEFKGQQFPVDVNWGSGYVEKENYFKKLTDYYFFTPSIEFLFGHYPTMPKKNSQLVKNSRSWALDKFTNMPNYSSYYFSQKIHLFNYNTQTIIITSDLQLVFKIRAIKQNHIFKAVLTKGKKEIEQNYENQQNVIDFDRQISELTINLPESGSVNYILDLYAAQQDYTIEEQQQQQQLDVGSNYASNNQSFPKIKLSQNDSGIYQQNENQQEDQLQETRVLKYNEEAQWNKLVSFQINYVKPK